MTMILRSFSGEGERGLEEIGGEEKESVRIPGKVRTRGRREGGGDVEVRSRRFVQEREDMGGIRVRVWDDGGRRKKKT